MKALIEIYKAWAPPESPWSAWAKPVLFTKRASPTKNSDFSIPGVNFMPDRRNMLILDLPGEQSVAEALAFAQEGYRPVPLYNGVCSLEAAMIVNVRDITAALHKNAYMVETLSIRPDAPPVFMLDANRMSGLGKQPGRYDNRWCVFPQDMPSAQFLQKQGIGRVIVRTAKIKTDLSHILYSYQKQGIRIFIWKDLYTDPAEISVPKPSRFRGLFYRLQVISGLKRNAAGGFGSLIPEPLEGGGSGYYGGFG